MSTSPTRLRRQHARLLEAPSPPTPPSPPAPTRWRSSRSSPCRACRPHGPCPLLRAAEPQSPRRPRRSEARLPGSRNKPKPPPATVPGAGGEPLPPAPMAPEPEQQPQQQPRHPVRIDALTGAAHEADQPAEPLRAAGHGEQHGRVRGTMMPLERRNEAQMLRSFWKQYPSYRVQPLLYKRYNELLEARAFCCTRTVSHSLANRET